MALQSVPKQELSSPKLPPQNLEAEQAVLGGILIENEALFRVVELLARDDFYRESHRKIFTTMLELSEKNEAVDLLTLTDRLKAKGELEDVGGSSYLSNLVDGVSTAANITYHAKIVREKAVLRNLIASATQIVSQGYQAAGNVDQFLDEAEKIIFEIAQKKVQKSFYAFKDIVKDSFKEIEKLYERKELVTGVDTGFSDFNKLTSGFQRGDLVIIAGRPSMGKTAFALNILMHAAMQAKIPCAIFSLEMSKEQLVQRMLCTEARVDSSKLRGGFLSESDWPNLTRAAGALSEAAIFIDDTPALNVLEVRAKARRLQKEVGLGMIVVDYLQLMRGIQYMDSREREISEISRSLKALAKELNVPVVALSQLNRGVEMRQNKRPQLADLRESGAIEQDADVIVFLYRESAYDRETIHKNEAELIIGKQRNGPVGLVKLTFLPQFTRFEDYTPYDIDYPQEPYAGPPGVT